MKKIIIYSCITLIINSCSELAYKRVFQPKKLSGKANLIQRDGWILTFNDEFNDKHLDDGKWSTRPYWGGEYHPDALHQHFGNNNFEFTDSTIKLIAKRDTLKRDSLVIPYSIGLLDNSKVFDQKYGYFEIRCKIPDALATWPAFWLVSRYKWPPEVDILEFYTSKNAKILCSNIHWNDINNKKRVHQWKEKQHRLPNPVTKFHVYGCEWNEKRVKWYFDNILIREVKQDTASFNCPMHMIINTGLQNNKDLQNNKVIFPNYFEVDYVRAYQRKNNLR